MAGAVSLAVHMINQDPGLLPDHNLFFVAYDTINSPVAIQKMTKMRDEQEVVAFIGPDFSCEHEAMVAAAWDMPMISYVRKHLNVFIITLCCLLHHVGVSNNMNSLFEYFRIFYFVYLRAIGNYLLKRSLFVFFWKTFRKPIFHIRI